MDATQNRPAESHDLAADRLAKLEKARDLALDLCAVVRELAATCLVDEEVSDNADDLALYLADKRDLAEAMVGL